LLHQPGEERDELGALGSRQRGKQLLLHARQDLVQLPELLASGEVRTAVTQITERLWGDVPAEDLATAGRVLSTVLARANAELAAA
jgi:hypothetical protein